MTFVTVSEIARSERVAPRVISDLFYRRKLDDFRCPIVSGRRLIPADYVPEVRKAIFKVRRDYMPSVTQRQKAEDQERARLMGRQMYEDRQAAAN